MYASSLIDAARCHLGAAGAPPAPAGTMPAALREVLEARLTDPRKPRGIRHSLGSLVSVLVAGVACGYSSPLAIAGAAAGWDQEVLAAHGTRRSPRTGVFEPPSASTLDRLPALLDAGELEAGLTAWLAPAALDPQLAARIAARAAAGRKASGGKKRRPPAGEALREVRADGWFRAAPGYPWLDPCRNGRTPARRPRCPRWAWTGTHARQGRPEEEGAPAGRHHPGHWASDRPGQGRQGRPGERGDCRAGRRSS